MIYLNDKNLYSQRGLYEKKWLSSLHTQSYQATLYNQNYVLFNN
jgi:hypothetical protein